MAIIFTKKIFKLSLIFIIIISILIVSPLYAIDDNINKHDAWAWWKDIIIPLISGGLTLLGVFISIIYSFKKMRKEFEFERKIVRDNSKTAIKTELDWNKLLLDNYLKEIKENEITVKNMYIPLYNSAWMNFGHEICKEEKIFNIFCPAYMDIDRVNNLTKAALSYTNTASNSEFRKLIEGAADKAKNSIESALKNLNNYLVSSKEILKS